MKRAFDFVVAGLAMVLLSPLLIAIALLVRLALGAPVLFRQLRPGFRGRPFICLKFRTMRDVRGSGSELLPDADRLTGLGCFLRRTSLDELPELYNVLRGDMSLVGPRPLLPRYLPRYSAEQMRRHDVPPGITGWSQINGRNLLDWDKKFALDLWYVEHHSFGLDLRILAKTVWTVLSGKGISQPGHATMPEFEGSSALSNSVATECSREYV